KQERIENIDVIRHEEVRPVGIETRRAASLDTRTRKKHDAAAEAALEPIVLAGVKKDSQKHEQRGNKEEVQAAEDPENRATQAKPADRAPAHEFNEPIGGIRVRRDEHCAAGVLAVVKRQEKRAPLVPLPIVIAAQGKRAPAQLHNADENPEQITEVAKRLEHAVGQGSNISSEANAQEVEGIDFARSVGQPEKVNGTCAAFEKCPQ